MTVIASEAKQSIAPRHELVIPRESGVSSTLRHLPSITAVSEYWVTRRSLSSGAHSRDPLAGDDK